MKAMFMFQAKLFKRTRFSCLMAAAVLANGNVHAATVSDHRQGTHRCGGDISLIPTRYLSVSEVASLSSPIVLENSFGSLTYREFDEDERPRRGNRIALAFVLARSADLGGTPFGALLMTSRALSVSAQRVGMDEVLVSTSADSSCRAEIKLRFTSKGNVMWGAVLAGRAR